MTGKYRDPQNHASTRNTPHFRDRSLGRPSHPRKLVSCRDQALLEKRLVEYERRLAWSWSYEAGAGLCVVFGFKIASVAAIGLLLTWLLDSLAEYRAATFGALMFGGVYAGMGWAMQAIARQHISELTGEVEDIKARLPKNRKRDFDPVPLGALYFNVFERLSAGFDLFNPVRKGEGTRGLSKEE